MAAFEDSVKAFEDQLQKLETNQQNLYRPDGQQRYTEPEHTEQLDRMAAGAREAYQALATAGQEAIASAQRSIMATENPDPSGLLTTSEVTEANARAGFVREECERLPLQDLLARVQSVLLGYDRVGQWLYLRYTRSRIADEQGHLPMGARNPEGQTLALLDKILTETALRFVDSSAQRSAKLAKERIAIVKSRMFEAGKKLSKADGSFEDMVARKRRQYESTL